MIKISGAQVIGYYLQAIPEDKYTPNNTNTIQLEIDEMITDFVISYRKMLVDQHADTYQKK